MVLRTAFSMALFCVQVAGATAVEVRPIFGAHPGYLFNVVEERDRREIEMVMLQKPKENKKPLSEIIFNEKLSKEFQDQYRYRFGQTQAEQVINNPGRTDEYTYFNRGNVTVQEYQRYQRQFGEYMARRLVEYHVDAYVKKDPELRPIYQFKDRISNLDVPLKKGYKLVWKYNFSGPSMEAAIDNPYEIEARMQIMMSGVISKPNDIIYTLGKQVTPRVKLEGVYRQTEELVQLVVGRRMTPHIGISLTGSTGQLPDNPQIYQNLVLLGFAWSE